MNLPIKPHARVVAPLPPLNRDAVITALSQPRLEWEEADDEEPLRTVHGSVGLLLDDVMDALGLTELEKGEIRGHWFKVSAE